MSRDREREERRGKKENNKTMKRQRENEERGGGKRKRNPQIGFQGQKGEITVHYITVHTKKGAKKSGQYQKGKTGKSLCYL